MLTLTPLGRELVEQMQQETRRAMLEQRSQRGPPGGTLALLPVMSIPRPVSTPPSRPLPMLTDRPWAWVQAEEREQLPLEEAVFAYRRAGGTRVNPLSIPQIFKNLTLAVEARVGPLWDDERDRIFSAHEQCKHAIGAIKDKLWKGKQTDVYDSLCEELRSLQHAILDLTLWTFQFHRTNQTAYQAHLRRFVHQELVKYLETKARTKQGEAVRRAIEMLGAGDSDLVDLYTRLAYDLLLLSVPCGFYSDVQLGRENRRVRPHITTPSDMGEPLLSPDVGSPLNTVLASLQSPDSFCYLVGLQQLLGNVHPRDRLLFNSVADLRCPDFELWQEFDARELRSMRFPEASHQHIQDALKRITQRLVLDCCSHIPHLDEILRGFNALRLRALSRREPRKFYVQRPTQSGDSNGVAFSLCNFPDRDLLLVMNEEEVNEARSMLQYYQTVGVPPGRIRLAILFETPERIRRAHYERTLKDFTERRIEMFCYPGGSDGLYQELANLSYIKDKPVRRYILDVHFQLQLFQYKPVGDSTGDIRRFIAEPQNLRQFVQRVHRAMRDNVAPDAREAIRQFKTEFLSNMSHHFLVKLVKHAIGPSGIGTLNFPRLDQEPLIVLCWVRGPNTDERESAERHSKLGTMVPKKGKPWHHATRQLLVTLRAITKELNNALGVPVWFVPIGDPIVSDYYQDITSELAQAKEPKNYNLIQFFRKLEFFQNRNRFNQAYFMLDLFMTPGVRLAQIGLRSGAIETGMYLGVPSIYIDIDTQRINKEVRKEADTTARMLGMTAEQNGFPLFHCVMSDNVIGVNARPVTPEMRRELKALVRGSLEGVPALDPQPEGFAGTLREEEILQVFSLLRRFYEVYPRYRRDLDL